MKILLLEDDKSLSESLKLYLELENIEVTQAYSSDDIYDLTFENNYDLYLIDVNIPGDDGFEVLKNLREAGDKTPAIFITALTDLNSIAKGFELEVDDYIKKPFSPEEIVIRVKSKYMKKNSSNNILRYKDIEYNILDKQLKKAGKTISLGETQLKIFVTLLKNKNHIVPSEELLDLLETPTTNALRVNIAKIKNKLNIEIKNIRTMGYILEEV